MLVEVQCDKFMKNGQIRESIRFHKGLNAVLSDDNGSNSIGESTFLMILDFVFGGSDYVKKCTDVQENVKNHTINFTFEFEGRRYRFSRNTVDYNKIVRCDSSYNPVEGEFPLTTQQYGGGLCDRYGLLANGITWRGAIARFIRVYKRDTLDEERPLRSSKDEKAAEVVKNYMRLFNRYSAVEEHIKQATDAEDEKEAFRKTTQQYNHVRVAKNDKERTANETRIIKLEQQEKEFAETEKDLATTFVLLNNEIVRIQEQITEIKNVPNVSQAILKEFARITTELNNLREANQNFDELERLKKVVSDYAETRDAVIHDQLIAIETTVNQAMREISLAILRDATHLPPVPRLEELNTPLTLITREVLGHNTEG